LLKESIQSKNKGRNDQVTAFIFGTTSGRTYPVRQFILFFGV